jgi:hypothetical protein
MPPLESTMQDDGNIFKMASSNPLPNMEYR